jgi:hypothetical protein
VLVGVVRLCVIAFVQLHIPAPIRQNLNNKPIAAGINCGSPAAQDYQT